MRGMTAKAAALLAGVMLMAGALQADARGGAKPAPLQFDFDFEATVQADGSVTDVRPDPALPETIQTMVRQRVATWRYSPTRWQGTAEASTVKQRIRAEAVPTREGGFALRIIEVTGQIRTAPANSRAAAMPMPPPRFPPELMRKNVNAVLVYDVLFGKDGIPHDVKLIYPSEPDSTIKRLDEASREAMRQWVAPKTFGGAPIACRVEVPIIFATTLDATLLHAPPEVSAMFEAYADRCPVAKLETPVAGTFL